MREFTVLSSCLLVEDIAEAARQKLIASTFLAWLFEETMESNQQMIHSRVTEKLQAFGAIQQHHQPIDVTHLSSTLMKKNFAAIRWLSRHYGVQCVLTVLPPHGSMKKEESQLLLFPITWANMDALELLRSVIASFRSNEDFETHMTGNETRRVHIYIDHSNITFSARDMTGTLINRRHLVELIEDGRTIEKRMAAESVPHRMKKDVVAAWNELGYTGSIVGRVAGQTEQNVDELIHTAMMTDAAKTYITPRKAVICTGDGNKNEGRPSNFPDTVTCLLQKGWLVELWSFEKSLNRMWLRFTDHYPEQFVIKYFDEVSRLNVICFEEKRAQIENFLLFSLVGCRGSGRKILIKV